MEKRKRQSVVFFQELFLICIILKVRERYTGNITQLNRSYTPVNSISQDLIREETVRIYNQLSDSLGVHRPPHDHPRVKTMLFTPFISMVGVTGSMGPFFCEFTLNGDLLPANYPATYAHELAHLLGITCRSYSVGRFLQGNFQIAERRVFRECVCTVNVMRFLAF